jgi:hypothetical protein
LFISVASADHCAEHLQARELDENHAVTVLRHDATPTRRNFATISLDATRRSRPRRLPAAASCIPAAARSAVLACARRSAWRVLASSRSASLAARSVSPARSPVTRRTTAGALVPAWAVRMRSLAAIVCALACRAAVVAHPGAGRARPPGSAARSRRSAGSPSPAAPSPSDRRRSPGRRWCRLTAGTSGAASPPRNPSALRQRSP